LLCLCVLLLMPPPCLAGDGTPPPGASEWLAVLAWLVGIAAGLTLLVQRWFPKRTPPIESDINAAVLACRRERQQHTAQESQRLEARLEQAEKRWREIEQASEERSRRLHERLERIIPVLYRIAGKLEVPID
jgi:hypothetical protein